MSLKGNQNRNIRLTHSGWTKLRLLKFQENMKTYSQLFEAIFDVLETDGHRQLADEIAKSLPNLSEKKKEEEPDKTIVVNQQVHHRLASFKIISLTSTGATSRGPGSVSLSDIVVNLINRYQMKTGKEEKEK